MCMRTAQFECWDHIGRQSPIAYHVSSYVQQTAYRIERRLQDRTFAEVLEILLLGSGRGQLYWSQHSLVRLLLSYQH